jgi:hypothetical protein
MRNDIIIKNELGRSLKGTDMVCFKVLIQNLSVGTEENHKNLQPEQPVSQRFNQMSHLSDKISCFVFERSWVLNFGPEISYLK